MLIIITLANLVSALTTLAYVITFVRDDNASAAVTCCCLLILFISNIVIFVQRPARTD